MSVSSRSSSAARARERGAFTGLGILRGALGVALASILFVASGAARAEPTPNERALAETLYQDAYKLMTDGSYKIACPKLQESDRLDPANGTKLLLAKCFEKTGRPASAWGLYIAVADAEKVSAGNKEREAEARSLAAGLRAELPTLTLVVSRDLASQPGLEVRLNGLAIGAPLWGSAIPVDLGAHTIEVTAPGKFAWKTSARAQAMRDAVKVELPTKLEDAPPPAPSSDAPAGAPETKSPPEPKSGPGVVRLHLETDDPDVQLHRYQSEITAMVGNAPVAAPLSAFVCRAPCDTIVDGSKGEDFIITGQGIPPSSRFHFEDRSGDQTLLVRPGSTARRAGGIALLPIGSVGAIAGGLLMFASKPVEGAPDPEATSSIGTAGAVMVGGGIALAVGGLLLLATSGTSYEWKTPPRTARPAAPVRR